MPFLRGHRNVLTPSFMIRKEMKSIFISLILSVLAGCSSSAPPLQNLLSKELKPPMDAALIYIVRPYSFVGVVRSPDFSINNQMIGEIENERYLYFYTYPTELNFVTNSYLSIEGRKSELLKIKFEAGKRYFLKFSFAEGYSQLSQQEGVKYINELKMGGNFKPYLIGNKSLNPPSHAAKQQATLEVMHKDYLKYDDNTREGVIKFAVEIEKREVVIGRIEEICNTKNIVLIADAQRKGGASFKTLDETFENNMIEIKFQCLY
jgi:hypothetical protein